MWITTKLMNVANTIAAKPAHTTLRAARVAVHLGEHVVEDVGDREEQVPRAEHERRAKNGRRISQVFAGPIRFEHRSTVTNAAITRS
jgi:hypothetical protein